jgi:hypothetical protein
VVTNVWYVGGWYLLDCVADLSPFIDMINIFEVFLPQLLRYPNPNDPLNGEAAALMMRHPKEYETKVKGKLLSHLLHSIHTQRAFPFRVRETFRNPRCYGFNSRR